MYRDHKDVVRFMAINQPTAELLEQLRTGVETYRTGRYHLQRLAESMPGMEPGRILAFGQSLLEDFIERGILIGLIPDDRESAQSHD